MRLTLVLASVAIVAFALMKVSPLDPVDAYLGADIARVGPEQRAQIEAKWGLDLPPAAQFSRWMRTLLSGDLGYSMTYNAPVADVLSTRFAASLPLMGLAWALSGVLGFALGVFAGARPGTWTDRVIRVYSYLLASTPAFWFAMLLLMVFSVTLMGSRFW